MKPLSGQRDLFPLVHGDRGGFAQHRGREGEERVRPGGGRAGKVRGRGPLGEPVGLAAVARQAGAGAAAGAAQAVGRAGVEGGVPEGAEQFGSGVGLRQDSEGLQRPERGAEGGGGGGGGGGGAQAHVGVVGQGQVGRERVGQVARGRRVAHHVGVKGRVGRVGPGHGQALPLVLHPAILEPHLAGQTGGEETTASA